MVRAANPETPGVARKFLSPTEVCEKLPGLTPHTLAMWRYRGKGPRYRKLGRIVVYPADELEAWLDTVPGSDGV